MVDYKAIIEAHYATQKELYSLLMRHSHAVADKAMAIARESRYDIDLDFVYEASMLHDIGIISTHAPSIFCNGSARYICHGIIGGEMLNGINMPKHALVCERHTGAGISVDEIIEHDFPLPHRDMLPISIEEKLICYADKFYSKSLLDKEKSIEEIREEMRRYGEKSLNRFNELHAYFEQGCKK